MERKVLVFYLHDEFVDKLLPAIYPDSFDGHTKFPKGGIEIIIAKDGKNIKVRTFLGLSSGYKSFGVDDIYIENSLITNETEPLVEKMKKEANVMIFDLREL